MKRPKAPKGPSETSGRRPPEGRADDGRSAPIFGCADLSPPMPALVVRVEIEAQAPEFYLEARTDEDERSLRRWLGTNPRAIAELVTQLEGILDDLREAA